MLELLTCPSLSFLWSTIKFLIKELFLFLFYFIFTIKAKGFAKTLQEKSISLIAFHHQGRIYLSRYVTIYICHLCQCQEKFKAILTFTYVKVVSIFTNGRIFVSMTYVNVSFTFVKVGFNICQDFFILCQC